MTILIVVVVVVVVALAPVVAILIVVAFSPLFPLLIAKRPAICGAGVPGITFIGRAVGVDPTPRANLNAVVTVPITPEGCAHISVVVAPLNDAIVRSPFVGGGVRRQHCEGKQRGAGREKKACHDSVPLTLVDAAHKSGPVVATPTASAGPEMIRGANLYPG